MTAEQKTIKTNLGLLELAKQPGNASKEAHGESDSECPGYCGRGILLM